MGSSEVIQRLLAIENKNPSTSKDTADDQEDYNLTHVQKDMEMVFEKFQLSLKLKLDKYIESQFKPIKDSIKGFDDTLRKPWPWPVNP